MSDNLEQPATILASCETCGDVQLPVHHAWIVHFSGADRAQLRFACPECGIAKIKLVDEDLLDMLVVAGVPLEVDGVGIGAGAGVEGAGALRFADIDRFRSLLRDDAALEAALVEHGLR